MDIGECDAGDKLTAFRSLEQYYRQVCCPWVVWMVCVANLVTNRGGRTVVWLMTISALLDPMEVRLEVEGYGT